MHENFELQSREETVLEMYVEIGVLILIVVIILVILWNFSKKINSIIHEKNKRKEE